MPTSLSDRNTVVSKSFSAGRANATATQKASTMKYFILGVCVCVTCDLYDGETICELMMVQWPGCTIYMSKRHIERECASNRARTRAIDPLERKNYANLFTKIAL